MKQRAPVSDRRLKAAAMAWATALLRARAFYLSGERPLIQTLHARDATENELLRLCVKLLAVKKGKR
jgi:hypothetical protein